MVQHRFYKCIGRFTASFVLVYLVAGCKVMKHSHNSSVTQDPLSRSDSTVVVRAGKIYQAGKFKRFWLGDHYRDTWLAPVEVPKLDFSKEKGGLEITGTGGGMQTSSLKLKGGDGKLYSLRSVQKDPTPTLPRPLQYSFADDLVQDQISASHPYGAFILPIFGDAAGIYHTNPRLVYVPDTEALGKYRKDFGGMLAMLEEDADEDWSDYADFGYTKNAVSTATVMEKLHEDNDNKVDQENLLRVRLFDIWVGDWDRHEGQFRWAELEDETGKLYRPIPEDRDNIFFRFDGFIPWWASRKWALRKFQDFQPEIRDLAGLNDNGRHLDRRFLTGLQKEHWIAIANDLQNRLTDEVIEKAIALMPDTVYNLTGAALISTLKARRDRLDQFAREYYGILAKSVDVVGTEDNEYFMVERLPGGDTRVKMYKASKDGELERLMYKRLFHAEETKEIRLYGREGKDFFEISGETDKGILVRAIGGEGEDRLIDASAVKGLKKYTIFYDSEEGEETEVKRETKLKISNSLDIHRYDFESFEYDYLGPVVFPGYNSDDGVFIGGGVKIVTHGFRKEPYATSHKIMANVAPGTSAWNFDYEGDFINVLGDVGLNMDLLVQAPNFFTNFFGFGNETEDLGDLDDRFHRVRFDLVDFFPGFTLRVGNHGHVKLGPYYQYAEAKQEDDRFISTPEAIDQLQDDVFEPNHYGGFKFKAVLKTIESDVYPENGIRWNAELGWLSQFNNNNRRFSQIRSDFSAFYTIEEPLKTTFAVRIGGASNAGDFTFYQANTLGGNAGLGMQGTVRGFVRDRFSGRSSIYQNNEIRIRLLRLPFYYMPFAMGVLGHFDQGRVWADGENFEKWHRGYGGGFWFSPLGKWVFTAVYTHSNEDGLFNLNLGFLF